jgi:CheY-like chemotaxis protein
MLATYLRACGSYVLAARGALSALSYVETQTRIDAVITDVSMPAIDGVEFVQRLRAHPKGRSIPTVALTGFYEQYRDTAGAGFNAFLRKPVNLEALCTTIRNVIGPR